MTRLLKRLICLVDRHRYRSLPAWGLLVLRCERCHHTLKLKTVSEKEAA